MPDQKHVVGYFKGVADEIFQPLREFSSKDEARDYVQESYLDDAESQPQNVTILKNNHAIFDGRTVQLN